MLNSYFLEPDCSLNIAKMRSQRRYPLVFVCQIGCFNDNYEGCKWIGKSARGSGSALVNADR